MYQRHIRTKECSCRNGQWVASEPKQGEDSINLWWEGEAWHGVSECEQVRKTPSGMVWHWLLEPKQNKEKIHRKVAWQEILKPKRVKGSPCSGATSHEMSEPKARKALTWSGWPSVRGVRARVG